MSTRYQKTLLESLRQEQHRYERRIDEAGIWLAELVRRLANEIEFTAATTRDQHEQRCAEFNEHATTTW